MEAVITDQTTETKGISRRFLANKGGFISVFLCTTPCEGIWQLSQFICNSSVQKGINLSDFISNFSTSKFLAKYEVTFGQYFSFMGMVVNGIQNKLYCLVGKRVAIIVYWLTNL